MKNNVGATLLVVQPKITGDPPALDPNQCKIVVEFTRFLPGQNPDSQFLGSRELTYAEVSAVKPTLMADLIELCDAFNPENNG